MPEYIHYVIATNRDELSPEEVIRFQNERGQAEDEIKELKIGFGMERMMNCPNICPIGIPIGNFGSLDISDKRE